ncbi:hypothetical protein GGI07_001026 [Coemansia sp. Benny D115]|nr:hypothetical protein GGI07_001026 [Coemansia sp. Benny D115]
MSLVPRVAIISKQSAVWRGLHTTAQAGARRRGNRKAELIAQRAAEAEAAREAAEKLRKLKDTQFLNSLVNPKALFESTQISQQDAATSTTQQDKGSDAPVIRRQADSGRFACQVTSEEVDLVTKVAPKAILGTDTGFLLHATPDAAARAVSAQADMVRRVVSLDNANSRAVTGYNVKKALETFGRSPGDSGSPEVQAAVWTVRINSLEEHLRGNHKDHQNRRSYTKLLHKRAKMLKYLKRESLERYYVCLKQLGLTKEMVEGEILQPKRVY